MRLRGDTGADRLALRVGAGLLVFAAGAVLAIALLPEWSTGPLRQERFFRTQFRRLASRAGFHIAAGEPRVSIVTGLSSRPGKKPVASLRVQVSHLVRREEEAGNQRLDIVFSPDGRPVEVDWENYLASFLSPPDLALHERLAADLIPLLLAPGESPGASRRGEGMSFSSWRMIDLAGSSPGQHLFVAIQPPLEISVERRPGGLAEAPAQPQGQLRRRLVLLLIYGLVGLAVAGVFLSLLLHGRIDLANGALLGLITLVSANLFRFFDIQASLWLSLVLLFFSTPWRALAVFFAWSAGESLLRSLRPDFTTSLDTLRLGRLGPRGGRALLLGFAFGAALAGLRLGIYALAAILPGIAPAKPSLNLPIFDLSHSPLGSGISTAALAALALALALRFLPGRWAVPAAALLAGYVLSPVQMTPFPVELAVNSALAGVLVWVGRRHGLTALLVAALASALLPAAVFSALHLAWMPGSFGLTAGLSAALLLLGFVGGSRSEQIETGYVPAPAFMRRLAEERRLQHEVDLLARMQIGLLPQEMPRLEGYEIAARSVLASEAGGDLYDFLHDDAGHLWIATGDVAGHGYSCAVAQAMVKAGLLSLIEPEESPAEVLRQLDRVLRGVSADHSFTSLALVRLDPSSGKALLANAGHPYPLVFASGRIVEVALPGLPLGRGPARPYADRSFQLPSGGVLLLCSDGLFEALDRNGNAYGFDRAREVLQVMGHRPAVEIVDALLNDCRRHLGGEPAPDDVTVVVVKRG
ncbi:MAG TPA: PP2C family protein-serine/threonine phosphatase [Thermoanaerobaculia bacterium]|jgi:sigma-B regulation protein RsbU (phosphoserine phosphatase)|nr:PP2C family protein-serine/threonine phosphatase [Thermoanaerobaculia bacterium]